MDKEEYDRLYSQLQARCYKCDKVFTSVADGELRVGKDNKKVVLCWDCCEKHKDEYRKQTQEEMLQSALSWIFLMGAFGGFGGDKRWW